MARHNGRRDASQTPQNDRHGMTATTLETWTGPRDCSGAIEGLGSATDIFQRLGQGSNVVRCDEAAWRFLGISLAGYNVLISLALAAVAGWGILASRRHRPIEAAV